LIINTQHQPQPLTVEKGRKKKLTVYLENILESLVVNRDSERLNRFLGCWW